MDAVRFCEEEVLIPGTPHHYALGPASQPRRGELCALFAFERDLEKSAYGPSEPNVAQIRLAWWHDELDRLAHGRARHLITRALSPLIGKYDIDVAVLHSVVEALRRDREAAGYATFEVLQKRCQDIEAKIVEMAARVCQPVGTLPVEFSSDLGIGLALARYICEFGRDVRSPRIFIPHDELERFAIFVTDVREGADVSACLNYQIARAIDYLDNALAILADYPASSQQWARILATIARLTLLEMQRDPIAYGRETVMLTPLRMWWIAFCVYHLPWAIALSVRKARLR